MFPIELCEPPYFRVQIIKIIVVYHAKDKTFELLHHSNMTSRRVCSAWKVGDPERHEPKAKSAAKLSEFLIIQNDHRRPRVQMCIAYYGH